MASSDDTARPSTSQGADESADWNEDYVEDVFIPKRRLCSSEILNMYNLSRLFRELGTREQGVAFAEEHGLILRSKQCSVHKKPMNKVYTSNETVGAFVCSKGKCRTKSRVSRTTGTWFENVKMSMPRIYYLIYAFAQHWPPSRTIWEDIEQEHCLSSSTVSDWYRHCRETIVTFQSEKQEYKGKIGGPGKTIQIDESKFGKKKFSKEKEVEGHWVLGMVEDGSEDLRVEICPENTPTVKSLVPLIQKHVEVGTTIYTDNWGAYDGLADHGFVHKRFNSNETDKKTRTQKIDTQWSMVQRLYNKECFDHSENFADVIIEYMWRRSVAQQKKDPFIELINVIKHVYDPTKKLRFKKESSIR